ncbi:MAG: ATP-binding protein, partial [Conexibacteraceae bacterium]|nr:ATP-binding protein [Conexibacteraceae bacterium]
MLLILLCLMPMVVAGLITLASLYGQRRAQLYQIAQREADLANADLDTILEGGRTLLVALAELSRGASCEQRLSGLSGRLPAYIFLAELDGTGGVVCASHPDLTGALATPPGWLAPLLSGTGFRVGGYATLPGVASGFLPLAYRPAGDAGANRVLIAALDLRWLDTRLSRTEPEAGSLRARSTLDVIDRAGIVLARIPGPDAAIGTRLGPEMAPAIAASAPGIATLRGADGRSRILAYDPRAGAADGPVVAVGFYPPDLLSDVDRAILRGALSGALAALAALVITFIAARRFIQRPTRQLLAAARRWRRGDLAARADLGGDHSEFGRLADDFNQMAAALEARVSEHAQQAQLLEARVAERTRELSESNNRLQVEIAERERTETVLHQAQKLQAVGRLAGGVAHDFNNLLATILGNLELVERRFGGQDDKLHALLARAMEAVQRGAQLTSKLLAFSRRQRLAARPTDLNRLVADLVALASSTLGRRLRIETRLDPDLWLAMVDPSQVEAAVLNLALNARDAMQDGGVLTLTTWNEIVGVGDPDAEPGSYVCVSVTDTGTGMPPEVQARAFEPFFTTKDHGEGPGLGLSQVYGVARQSGGTVRLQSMLGHGTTVTLLLPRALESADALVPNAKPERCRTSAGLVLLVDDDAGVRQVSVEMLRDLGYDVVEAAGAGEALATVRTLPSPPALVVLDYAMPGMNGLLLATALREVGIGAPIVLATGYAELSEDQTGVLPDAVLRKPYSLAELERTLQRLR